MRFERVRIAGLGIELPPAVLSSSAIEDRLGPLYARLGLVPGRLEMMTGIRERRYWPEPIRPSEAAARAGRRALEASGIDKNEIGCLIHASVCRDFLEPATACVVHDALGLSRRADAFDLSNACLGVANGMMLVATLIESGRLRAGLVVSGENGKPLVDSTIAELLADGALSVSRKTIKTAFTSLTIGSGGAAVLLADESLARSDSPRLLGGVSEVASEHHRLCQGGAAASSHADTGVEQETALTMRTDAEALLEAGLDLARAAWPRFLEELEWTAATPTKSVTHQVGRAHTRALYESLGLPLEGAGYVTYDRLGNVGSASLPMSLSMAAGDGFIRPKDTVALLGIGSGLSTIMMGARW